MEFEKIKNMGIEELEKRIAEIKIEKEAENADIETLSAEVDAIEKRKLELKNQEEQRKVLSEKIANNEVPDIKVLDVRTGGNNMNEKEIRAKSFVETGKTEFRILTTSTIAKPTKVGEMSGLADSEGGIIDDVYSIPLEGNGAYVVPYKKADAKSADHAEGTNFGGTASDYDHVTINPTEWGVFDEISNRVARQTSVSYMNAVEESAVISLRATGCEKIIDAVLKSTLAKKLYSIALDADYLRSLVLGYNAIKGKGECALYISREDLITLGKIRGTQDKKPVYEFTYDPGSTISGTIKEGATVIRFRIEEHLTKGTQLFGQPLTIHMPMWNDMEVKTDEHGEFFKKGTIGIIGSQDAGADLCALNGMEIISQAAQA